MTTLGEVRTALKATLDEIEGTYIYDRVPDVTQLPAIVVVPSNANLLLAGGKDQDWVIELLVLVARSQLEERQDQLDALLSATGDKSIQDCIRRNKTLGIAGVNAAPASIDGYGGMWSAGGRNESPILHIGARMRVNVFIDNT